ncbi:glycoside hydrolase family 9 protein [Leptolyngbya sp. KIOST-1]|uniref:glycoside hydrolase family 9 protein n=1 Tax=Leptolyngbya sp. KIOST-1 TaxID=1229172 RepID=UPI00068F2EE4|nr:glycoside hydrolase family 9 protein [Leptolyngbya sp. KIOST-1]
MGFAINRWPRRVALWLGLLAFAVACGTGTLGRLPNASADQPEVSIAVVSPEVVEITVHQGEVIHARQVPYQPQPQDRLETEGFNTWLIRQGEALGTLVSPSQDILYGFDRFIDTPFNANRASQPRSYRIQSGNAPGYRQSTPPVEVYRKSKPVDLARIDRRGNLRWAMEHRFYLRLPAPLSPGQTYQIQSVGQNLPPLRLTYQPEHQLSEAVHVSAVGFRPDDSLKVGFLSTWMGTGGGLSYPEGLPFRVIDEATDQAVFTGQAQRRHHSGDIEDPRDRTYTLADVDELDFSTLDRPGRYRLCVDTVGCSHPFAVAEDAWQQAFYLAARGFYHQRSGIALGPPYTDVVRPRPFHPDDGVTVYHSNTGLMDTGNGLNAQGTDEGNFANLVKGKTTIPVDNAWGGYFDAGDWDRRIQHLEVARWLLELIELFPQPMELALNIPESDNDLPDLLDEALWGVDFFRRLQTPEGGIRGGIESEEHPRRGETSWQESLSIMAYAPDPWSSYIYAGVAARTARLLGTYAPDQVQGYRDSALAAWTWAEDRHCQGIEALDWVGDRIEADRALAALEIYRLSGDRAWHDRFLAAHSAIPADARDNHLVAPPRQEIDFLYGSMPADQVDADLQTDLQAELLAEADAAMATGQTTAFGWAKSHPYAPVGWGNGLGAPKARTLLRAHALTGQDRYLNAALLACQFSAGANPDNMTYTTGLGHKSPQHPLIVDQRITGDLLPGITLYGPIDTGFYGDEWHFGVLESVTVPPARQWPSVETYLDIYFVPSINEFTVMQSMADAAYAWGYLTGRT